jgi:hypothetical protein
MPLLQHDRKWCIMWRIMQILPRRFLLYIRHSLIRSMRRRTLFWPSEVHCHSCAQFCDNHSIISRHLNCIPKTNQIGKDMWKFWKEKHRWGVEVKFYTLFNLGAGWGWVLNATPRPIYQQERSDTHCMGGWVEPRDGLDGCGIPCSDTDLIPGPSSP